jgi:sulfhydrogenase subunit beta (sulfur reductase)
VKTLVLPREQLDFFASVLQQFGEIHAPWRRMDHFVFRRLERWSEIRLDYTRTLLPPKKYVLPPRECLFRYRPREGYVPETEGLDRRIVLFGVHACDIYGINILDQVFAGRYPDPYYQARRKNVAIVGIDCTPDEHCFCRSMRADFVSEGFDLFLQDLGDRYLTFVGTALGDDMVLATGGLFQPVKREDIEEYKARSAVRRNAFRLDPEIRDLPEIFEMEYENELWDELGAKCVSCGACSTVCPTCYCYDVNDRWPSGPSRGCGPATGIRACSRRTRRWRAARISGPAARAGSSSGSTTSRRASWPSTAAPAASGAGAASRSAPLASTS